MKIATNIESITTGLDIMEAIVTDSLLQDELKNIIFWVKGGSVVLVAHNIAITNCTQIEATVTYDEDEAELEAKDEYFVQLQAKTIKGVISSFAGLKKTVVSSVEFEFIHDKQGRAESAIIAVYEKPLDPEMENAEKYYQRTRFRLTPVRLKEVVRSKISVIKLKEQRGDIVKREDMLAYLNCLVPTIAKDARDSIMTRITFKSDFVYTAPVTHVAMLENKLPECLQGFCITNTIAKFLINFVSIDEYFSFEKEVHEGIVIITVTNDHSTAVIEANTTDKGFDITPYNITSTVGIAVDKDYFCDVLKRLSLSTEKIGVKVEVSGGVFRVSTKTMVQNIPIVTFKGEGEFNFEIQQELLSAMSLSHATYFGDVLYIYFVKDDARGSVSLIFKDNSSIWKTAVMGLKKNGIEDGWQ
jgi:hypothetical protein